jgi:hypothetical protein
VSDRDVKSMTMQGDVAPGSMFRWKAGPGTITSTIQRLEPQRLIGWTGKTLGIKAIHFWHLDPRNGKTLVRTEESYEGLVAQLLRLPSEDARPCARRRTRVPQDRSRTAHDSRAIAPPHP